MFGMEYFRQWLQTIIKLDNQENNYFWNWVLIWIFNIHCHKLLI